MKTTDEVRAALADLLGYPPHPKLWGHLADPERALVENVQQGLWDVSDLFREYRALEKLFRGAAKKKSVTSARTRHSKPVTQRLEREQAIAVLAAYDARDNEAVVSFRKEVLRGKTIPIGEIDKWVRDHAKRDGDSSKWAEIAMPSSCQFQQDRSGRVTLARPVTVSELESPSYRVLRYKTRWEVRRLIAAGGVLERLWRLSKDLSRIYSWDEGEATTFVLSGRPPKVPLVRSTYLPKSPRAFSRMVLDIDPAATPAQVARRYREFRQEVLVKARTRSCTEKHLKLAVMFESTFDASASWRRLFEQWNVENPRFKYKAVGNFKRDCGVAHRRLLHPDYVEIPPEVDDDYDMEPAEIDLAALFRLEH